jgi:hypothetical protein
MLSLVVPVLLAATLTQAGQEPAATIIDSGSTNRAGFRIVLDRSGTAEITVRPRRFESTKTGSAETTRKPTSRVLSKDLVEKFFVALKVAGRLDSLSAIHCAKSASFGSTLTVALGNDQSPDLSCGDGGNPALRDLIGVVRQIVALADVQDMRLRREVR